MESLRADAPTTSTGTWDDVDQLVADAAAWGEPVRATIEADVRAAAPTLAPSVHRLVAESVTDVRRHGPDVSRTDVAVVRSDDALVVTVLDDGLPGDPLHARHVRHRRHVRAQRAARRFAVRRPAPDGGWLLHAELPIGSQR